MGKEEKGVLLCVDDERMVLDALKTQLKTAFGNQYLIEVAESAEEGLEILDEMRGEGYQPLVVISDWLMPGMKGDVFLREAKSRFPSVVKIMLSGQADPVAVEQAWENGGLDSFIIKPWDIDDLIGSINSGLGVR
ncbi:MAG: response regulator [Gammaproteobacteria bacterium]|nr:response regulator [Gammaproteobacteria bacterium]